MATIKQFEKQIIRLGDLDGVGKMDGLEGKFKDFAIIPIEMLVEADWNYKKDDEDKAGKLKANLQRNGQIENLIVRRLDTGAYEVVNGNHRLKVMIDLGFQKAICYDLGVISANEAKRKAIETNETKFSTDNLKLAEIFQDLIGEFSIDDLSSTMPFSSDDIDDFSSLLNFDWDQYAKGEDDDDEEKDGTDGQKEDVTCPHCGQVFTLGSEVKQEKEIL